MSIMRCRLCVVDCVVDVVCDAVDKRVDCIDCHARIVTHAECDVTIVIAPCVDFVCIPTVTQSNFHFLDIEDDVVIFVICVCFA